VTQGGSRVAILRCTVRRIFRTVGSAAAAPELVKGGIVEPFDERNWQFELMGLQAPGACKPLQQAAVGR
jgi:hypothetical protein